MEARRQAKMRQREKPVRPGSDAKKPAEELPAAKPVAASLPAPRRVLPVYQYRAEHVQSTATVGDNDDSAESFDDRAPEGGLLVGAQVITGKGFGGSVSAIEPIFQAADQYKSQGLHGATQGKSHVLLAPAGYAVGGAQIRSGLVMDAIRLAYMPIKGTRLDAEQVQFSEWVGGDGGSENEISGKGSLVVGVGGTFRSDEMKSLRLQFVDRAKVRIAPQRAASPDRNNAESFRTWKSANGKFTVEARVEAFDGKQAVLIKRDGKKSIVAAEKLSEADQLFLRNWHRTQAEADKQPKKK
jgi:hypothetical protein